MLSSSQELQQALESRPEAEQFVTETVDATDGFEQSKTGLADLIKDLENYTEVAEKFTKLYDDFIEWFPTIEQRTFKLQPISTEPDIIEEQKVETEVWLFTSQLTLGLPLFFAFYFAKQVPAYLTFLFQFNF